jgi:hypothetical protein
MTTEITIPLLPCHAITPMLEFYRALGFDITYQQTKPNNYAVVQRGGIELHFFTMREYIPANSYSSCYVRVADINQLYQAFVDGLRQAYGRLPSAGIPRVIPLKNKSGRREFIVVDPGGNWIRIGQPNAASADDDTALPKGATGKLARATHGATLLADYKGDYQAAATMIDVALAQPAPTADRMRALIFRAGLAITMDDQPRARTLLAEVRQTPLDEDDRAALLPELQRADDLEHQLQ